MNDISSSLEAEEVPSPSLHSDANELTPSTPASHSLTRIPEQTSPHFPLINDLIDHLFITARANVVLRNSRSTAVQLHARVPGPGSTFAQYFSVGVKVFPNNHVRAKVHPGLIETCRPQNILQQPAHHTGVVPRLEGPRPVKPGHRALDIAT